MAFSIFILLTFLTCTLFVAMKKELTIVENTFIYLLILVLSINVSWIVSHELKFIEVTKEPVNNTAFLFYRSVILPMILVVYVNFIQKVNTITRSLLITIASLIIMLLLSGLTVYFDIFTYKKWNFGYDLLYFVFLQWIAYYAFKFIRKVEDREVKYS
ncbi:hypothetical protein JOC86_004571 [Bacillus pakistanensis]|uniref:Uncharacterized protein n=1 Tax=Rossellomorea pakistanensis TaxID=992288 RepID=A0ABS2NKE9_9BACI|nr:hypothetical protein [Bacillus pakistanensis]MBM7587996.1 hypothetical protein [Bacillus pakistanensis]